VSENVARRFRLPGKGGIRVGSDADLTLIDLSRSTPITEKELLDRHRLSPYVGRTLCGTVRRTMLRGQTVFLDGEVVGEPRGKHVRPKVTEK